MTTKRPDERLILDILDGYLGSKVLMAAYQLDMFTQLQGDGLSPEAFLDRSRLPARTGRILLDACAGLGLLDVQHGRYRTPPELVPFLTKGAKFQTTSYLISYYDEVYSAIASLSELVRENGTKNGFRPRDYFVDDVNQIDPSIAADYSRYMDATIPKIAETVLNLYDFSKHKRLLDLCGGTGTFAAAILSASPTLAGASLDVPACAAIGAQRYAHDPALAGRLQVLGGDVFTSPFPPDTDVVTMCRSAHDWDDERVSALFARVHELLPKSGRLVIVERMVPDDFDPAARALYLRAVYFVVKSHTACYRSPAQYRKLLTAAGFGAVEHHRAARAPYEFFQGLHVISATKV